MHTSEEYSDDGVTVTVEWIQQVGALYDITVVPVVPIMFTGNVSRQLTFSYNTDYNFSVVAVTPCGNATAFIRLNYGMRYKYCTTHALLANVIILFYS